MRFIQMWFYPEKLGLTPSVEQLKVNKTERTNKFLPIVSNQHKDALPIKSDAIVCSCFLGQNNKVSYQIQEDWGVYLYVLEGGPIKVNNSKMKELSAAKIKNEKKINLEASNEGELLLVEAYMKADYTKKL